MVFGFVHTVVFCSSPGILRQPLLLTRERETLISGNFAVHVCLMALELASLEEEERRRRKKKKRKLIHLRSDISVTEHDI